MITKKRIAILGSTGSIGTQTLEVIEQKAEYFEVKVLTANSNVDLLAWQAKKFQPEVVVIGYEDKAEDLSARLKGYNIEVLAGVSGLSEVVAKDNVDVVLTALVGYSGLIPTINAIKKGKDIALANKETLVVAGDLIQQLARTYNSKIIPVDSEHSAIYQCLTGEKIEDIEKIYLTASGGPFLNFSEEDLDTVTCDDALKHPNWNMGNKITIDSATMMNKGFEAIEAKWLFDLDPDQIDVIIHPQSIIHSLVQFVDGSMKAQMGLPDMKLPILYALSAPHRVESGFKRFNFAEYPQLTFQKPDTKKFRNLAIAFEAMEKGGNVPCIANAANEVAVEAFLKSKIGYKDISSVVEQSIEKIDYIEHPNLEDYIKTDRETRQMASEIILNK
jgi:1-deoxy-D-xylulose-5-phosphate reductoisomerase